MLLRDVIDELRFGELSGANLGENETEGVSPFNYERLTNYINAALTALHTRLPLNIREVLLEQKSTITMYKLNSAFAQSNLTSTEPIKYLIDLADPFDDLLLKVDEVYNEVGIELSLDDMNDPDSLFRPAPNLLQIPYPIDGQKISIVYRSNHPKLLYKTNETEFLSQTINLPESYLSAIVNYVVYKYRTSFDTPESMQAAQVAKKLFDVAVDELITFGLTPEDNLLSTKLENNGWV